MDGEEREVGWGGERGRIGRRGRKDGEERGRMGRRGRTGRRERKDGEEREEGLGGERGRMGRRERKDGEERDEGLRESKDGEERGRMGRRLRKDGEREEGMRYTYQQMKVLLPLLSAILGNTPLDKEGRRSPLEGMEGASYCITLQYWPLEE